MDRVKSRHIVRIPQSISVFYCEKKRIIVLKGLLNQKSLKLKVKLALINKKSALKVSSKTFSKMPRIQERQTKSSQGTITALIKQAVVEVSFTLYQKLRLEGVGYRMFKTVESENKLLFLKLGHSHLIYAKISKGLYFFCLRSTKLFIFGNSYQNVSQTASTIRSNKIPEPYKGKGLSHENERILLKEGKKV